jgi:hypothetical protein
MPKAFVIACAVGAVLFILFLLPTSSPEQREAQRALWAQEAQWAQEASRSAAETPEQKWTNFCDGPHPPIDNDVYWLCKSGGHSTKAWPLAPDDGIDHSHN